MLGIKFPFTFALKITAGQFTVRMPWTRVGVIQLYMFAIQFLLTVKIIGNRPLNMRGVAPLLSCSAGSGQNRSLGHKSNL